MKLGNYLFTSDGSIYSVDFKETRARNDKGVFKTTKYYWATCIKSDTKKTPGTPFKFKPQMWEPLIRTGYIKFCE